MILFPFPADHLACRESPICLDYGYCRLIKTDQDAIRQRGIFDAKKKKLTCKGHSFYPIDNPRRKASATSELRRGGWFFLPGA
jgi:hypothetical protein